MHKVKNIDKITAKKIYNKNYVDEMYFLFSHEIKWKTEYVIKCIDEILKITKKDKLKILDVGGGFGFVMHFVGEYCRSKNIEVEKHFLDISKQFLEAQIKMNPDFCSAKCESIEDSNYKYKEFDIVILCDVLEHVYDLNKTLQVLKYITNWVIFTIPLEINLEFFIFNLFSRWYNFLYQKYGHVRFFSYKIFKNLIERSLGKIVKYYYMNVFQLYLQKEFIKQKIQSKKIKHKIYLIIDIIGAIIHKINPKLASWLFCDELAALVKVY